MNNSIIDILNKDPKVKQLMRAAQQAAIKQGITPEEWKEGKKDLLYLSIAICPEAIEFQSLFYWKFYFNQTPASNCDLGISVKYFTFGSKGS